MIQQHTPYQSVFLRHSFIYENIPTVLSLFYLCITAFSTSISLAYASFSIEQYNKMTPPPLLFFTKALPPEFLIAIIHITPIVLLATALFPRYQSLRVLSGLFYVFSHGFYCSFGLNDHNQLTLIYGAIALSFMPHIRKDNSLVTRTEKHIRILHFWIFHGALLMPYFVSGLTKFFMGGIYQLIFNEVSAWSPYTMAYATEWYLWRIGSHSWLGGLIIDHVWLSVPIYLGIIALELSVLLPLFFPKIWKLIILELVLFHIFSIQALNILFYSNVIVLLVVLYNTPFSYPLQFPKKYYAPIILFYKKVIRR